MKYTINDDTVKKVCDIISSYSGISYDELIQNVKLRDRRYVATRQVAMYFLKEFTTLSHREIGEKLGGKDHATSIHGIKTINKFLSINRDPIYNDSDFIKRMQILTLRIEAVIKEPPKTDLINQKTNISVSNKDISDIVKYFKKKIRNIKQSSNLIPVINQQEKIDELTNEVEVLNKHIRLLRDKIKRFEHPYAYEYKLEIA